MPLSAGDRFGPYEILAPLGAGGMGEVYRARDARLNRDVALKVLPAAFAQDPERVARFEREAKLLASLNHPRIGALYGLEESEGRRVLVLELVAGESLAERLRRGALPLDEALDVAAQVASALEAAHESGIVHRDLKPGNVMLRPDGTVKVLDFGLAKGGAGETTSGEPNLSASPTMTLAATQHGVILGTAAYMSPEQARGKAVDRRADIWSLGCLLFELLSGRQAFSGETVSDTLAAILKSEPDWSALPARTPARVTALIRRCLRKDPVARMRDAGDARIELEEARAAGDEPAAAAPPGAAARAPRGLVPALGAALVLALAAAAFAWLRGGAAPAAPVRFTLVPPPGIVAGTSPEQFAISPDGATLAFVGTDSSGTASVWLRDMNSLVAHVVPGTENAVGVFWAPDARALAFFADGKLKKVGIGGGAPQALCDAPDPRGGAWGSAGTIVFAPDATGPLEGVSADGGAPVVVLRPDSTQQESGLRFPQFLPDGRSFLFVSMPHPQNGFAIGLARLGSPQRRQVMLAGAAPVYAAPGWLVTVLNNHLVAQPFDAGSGALRGKPVDLGDAPQPNGHDGCFAVTLARDGKLAYESGSLSNTRLVFFDRTGREAGTVPLPAGRWESISPSPDGARAIVSRRISGTQFDLWLVDLRGGPASLFASGVGDAAAAWSWDGREAAYNRQPKGPPSLVVKPVDGGAERVVVPEDALFKNPDSWSPDNQYILFSQSRPGTGWDLLRVPAAGGRRPEPVQASPANEFAGTYSFDGRWLGYTSDESGRPELYVRPVGAAAPRVQISSSGFDPSAASTAVDWSHDLREIVTVWGDVRAYALEVGAGVRVTGSRTLFTMPASAAGTAVMPDHSRILAMLPVSGAEQPAMAVVTNWRTALRAH